MNTIPYQHTKEGKDLIKHELKPQMRQWAANQMRMTIARMGQRLANNNDEVLTMATKDFLNIILPTVDWMSKVEIEYVLQIGAVGELGDNVAMSSRTISTWFRNYQKDYRPKIAAKYVEEQIINQKKIAEAPRREQTREEAIKHLQEVYEDYHEGHMLLAQSYDIAVKHGIIPKKYKNLNQYKSFAESEVQRDQAKNLAKGKITMTELKRLLKDWSKGSYLDQSMRKKALATWFDFMKIGKGFEIH